jgi:hypothetical protein
MTPHGKARHAILASFTAARAALSFATAAAGSGLPDAPGRVRCHRGPEGAWWVLAEIGAGPGAELAVALGGTVREPTDAAVARLDAWPRISPARLAVDCALPASMPATLRTANVLTSGGMSHRVLRRCLDTGARVGYQVVTHRPISGTEAVPGLLIRLTATRGSLPVRAVAALDALPVTHVFQPCDPAERLLLNVRHRLPVPETIVAAGLPDGEVWLVGSAGLGTRVLCAVGSYQDATDMLIPEIVPLPPPPAAPVPERFGRVRVRVVPHDRAPLRADAILLDDPQLALLRTFLTYRRLAEDGLLLLGAGHHLLVEPGGLVATIPFGRRMWKPSPAPLFIEAGCDLMPPVPTRAHRRVFGLDGDQVVAMWRDGSQAFKPEHGVPVWTGWLAAPPEVSLGLSAAALELLDRLAAAEPPAPSPPAQEQPSEPQPGEAARLELEGRYAEAARILEDSGQWLQAAMLWQEAAAHEDAESAEYSQEFP